MTTPFFDNLMREDEYRQGEELRRRREAAPRVKAKEIAVGQQFQYGSMGIFTRVDPQWHDSQNIFGVSGHWLVKVDIDDVVQTVPA